MTKRRRAIGIGIVIGGLWLSACGGGGGSGGDTDVAADPGDPVPVSAALSEVADCDTLHAAIRTDARRKIERQAEELRAQAWLHVQTVVSATYAPTAVCTPTPMATAGAGGEQPHDGGSNTDTNVQVPGVDEADIVETDGDRIYLLHENALLVLNASPPEATTLLERITIEGGALGMFVADGRALVLSTVFDAGDLGGSISCHGIGAPFPFDASRGATAGIAPGCQASFVKLTLLDVTVSPARTVRELFVEGYPLDSRRHGTRVRVAVQQFGMTPASFPDQWTTIWSPPEPTTEAEVLERVDRWEQQALAAIDASTLEDWVPAIRERVGGRILPHPLTCANARVPEPGFIDEGQTMILGVDIASENAPPEDTLIRGLAARLYANGDTLVLAAAQWDFGPFVADPKTVLHVFALPADSLATVYRGSGFVPGILLSQFAIDVQGDVLRLATSIPWVNGIVTGATHVVTARVRDEKLAIVGTSADIAPGEQLFGARFLGDRVYLVTFRQIDPLFVVDVSDPTAPAVLGQVELPGFSEYLHPLGDHGLLTIGRAADPFGRTEGVAVRTFDVGDPAAPRLTAEHVLPSDGWTPAETNHLAFTFDPDLGLLALPFNRSGGFATGEADLVLIGVDAAGALDLRGTITQRAEPFAPCPIPFENEVCSTYLEMLRGLFIDGNVYSISTAAVQAHALTDLTTPLATVELP